MTIRCVCIDDEPLARQGINIALKPYNNFDLVAQFNAGDEFLVAIKNNELSNIDVLFVDIEMPRMNGFELIEQYPHTLPLVIFVTAYDQYAVKAFEQQALDYILKPIAEERFEQVVLRIKNALSKPDLESNAEENTEKLLEKISLLKKLIKTDEATISIKTDDGYFRVKTKDIIMIESVGDHVCIHLSDKQLITRNTLKHYTTELTPQGFHQIHRSTTVNINHAQQISKLRFGDYQIKMSNGETVRVSRRYRDVITLCKNKS